MNPQWFWKNALLWFAIVVALVIATALIPESEKWGPILPFAIILPSAIVWMCYLKQKQKADPDSFGSSARVRKNYLIANIAIFALFAAGTLIAPHTDSLQIGVTLLFGVVAVISAFRLIRLRRTNLS